MGRREAANKRPAVILAGYVSGSELLWRYADASGFVLPRLLAGFGLPAAAAISYDLVPLSGKKAAK